MILIKGGRVFVEGEFRELDVLIEGQKIKAIGKDLITDSRTRVIDARGKLVTPGFIDVHVHLREPGYTHKETIASGTRAAARGGFTTVAAMPNTDPVLDNPAILREVEERIEKEAVVRVYLHGAISEGLQGEKLVDFAAMAGSVLGFSDDGRGVQDEGMMKRAMEEVKGLNKMIAAHCEDESLNNGGYIHEGDLSRRLGIRGISSASEYRQLARDLDLVRETGAAYHACHISTEEAVELIRQAKKEGLPVSCEVTPHHLLLSDKDIDINDADYKMNPPLRSEEDRLALLEGVKDGTIDIIATDHAPHHAEEKARGFAEAPFGIAGLETCFSLLYTYLVLEGVITLERLVEMLTVKPAGLFGLETGVLEAGREADLVIIDPEASFIIDVEDFHSKGKNTPFKGYRCRGKILRTLVGGREVYRGE
ncbi:MAG: dihydroorotase [Halanaerobiaceae bacterium]|nr:dihydroorotase [Halanaerobiaceae bacterium]